MHKISRLVSVLAADCGAQANSGRSDPSGLKIGDHIHVHQNRIEPDDRDLP